MRKQKQSSIPGEQSAKTRVSAHASKGIAPPRGGRRNDCQEQQQQQEQQQHASNNANNNASLTHSQALRRPNCPCLAVTP